MHNSLIPIKMFVLTALQTVPHALHTTIAQAVLTLPLLLEVEFALTALTHAQLVMELEPAQLALVDSTSSKDSVKLLALLVLVPLTVSALAILELFQTVPVSQAAHLDQLQFQDHVFHAILTVLNAQVAPTNAQNVCLDSKLMPLKDVFLPLNAHTVKNSQMENVKIFAIMDSYSMKVFVSLEDASLDMLIMDLEDAQEVHLLLSHQDHQLLAQLDNSF